MEGSGESLVVYIGVAIIVYIVVMFGISIGVKGKVNSVEDFVVAGRRLPLMLAAPTLLATWFGAGRRGHGDHAPEVRGPGRVARAAVAPSGGAGDRVQELTDGYQARRTEPRGLLGRAAPQCDR